ncbi:AAA+ ATPase superfamily predicted ATPase [Prosthecobacter fusiformis]|uniref:AAA+ ATPase superfamily predicted ATPase n=1 Tax=Prosthecobacter fusiformis TaxID=48464 RepID=A0A4R7RKH8_9BACT|nr:ATP-binding protein [Prosthecobacter fusiformis]TDU64125.1 AAA+ ATPase superfamily predicted ATPase [Prosthecobacter fusiformis]
MSQPAKLKIGSPATGDHYFPRTAIRKRLIRALNRDHMAFLGPRRTGKTSILRDLERYPPANTSALYLDLQGLRSAPAWLTLMLKETKKLLQTPPDKLAWLKEAGKGTASVLKRIEQISVTGIKLTPGQPAVDLWEPIADEFLTLLRENELPIVFMLDEFPWFLGHVASNHSPAEVDATLNWFRKARQELADGPTRFLVTGSIGLTGLLRRLGLSPAANDFDSIDIEPLTDKEALQFLEERAEGEGIVLSAAARRRILARLGVGWPLLLATFLSEVQEHAADKGPTVKDIDQLYEDRMVRGNRNKYCQEMFTRLTKLDMFSSSERRLAEEILRDLCRSPRAFGNEDFDTIHARLVPDAAHRSLLATELDYVLETLRHDGYLVRQRDGLHTFASHILRDFWRHHTA